jgi:hypothetical protein
MCPFVNVRFRDMTRDPSLEAAIHRWVARLEWASVEVHRAEIVIERIGRRRTAVHVSIGRVTGASPTATASHADAYVAVSSAFREVRLQLLDRGPAVTRSSSLALAS